MQWVRFILVSYLTAVMVVWNPSIAKAADGANWNSGNSGWAMDYDLSNVNGSFLGEVSGDEAGGRLANVGDVDGDGYDDILVGAYRSNEAFSQGGQAYLIFGKATGSWSMDASIAGAGVISFYPEASGDSLGIALGAVGDIDGDGLKDFMIAGTGNDEGGNVAGQVYLFFGKTRASWPAQVYVSSADASFWGETVADYLGFVEAVGDVNNDGKDDFVLGSCLNDEADTSAGQSYLILGDVRGNFSMDMDLSTAGNADASFLGEGNSDTACHNSGVGDVNGDGFDDFLIGAGLNNEAYLIFGKAGGWSRDVALGTASDASFLGETAGDDFGDQVAGVGDVNNDGFDDFIIGASGDDDAGTSAGQVYLVLGRADAATAWSRNMAITAAATASFWGEAASDIVGDFQTLSGAGDLNNDGFDDFLIAGKGNDAADTSAGQIYAIFGKSSGWVMDTSLSTANASFWGEGASDQAGSLPTGKGDYNNDGYDDILIGAAFDGAGQLYIILSPANPTASAGSDQTVNSGAAVTLNGSASVGATSYSWVQTAGTTVTLSGSTTVSPTFTAPTVSTATTLTFRLTVTNSIGNSTDTVSITVNPGTSDSNNDSGDTGGTDSDGTTDGEAGGEDTVLCSSLVVDNVRATDGTIQLKAKSGERKIMTIECLKSNGEPVEWDEEGEEEPLFSTTLVGVPAGVRANQLGAGSLPKPEAVLSYVETLKEDEGWANQVESGYGRIYGSYRPNHLGSSGIGYLSVSALKNASATPSYSVISKQVVWQAPEDVEGEEVYTFQISASDNVEEANASISQASRLSALTVTNKSATIGAPTQTVEITVSPSSNATLSTLSTNDAEYIVASADQIAGLSYVIRLFAQADERCTVNWIQTAGPTVDILDADTLFPWVTTPSSADDLLTLTFEAQCIMGETTYTDSTNVFVIANFDNTAPLADAGRDKAALNGSLIALEGAGYDADGDTVSCVWLQNNGVDATLTDAQECTPSYYFLGVNDTKAFCLVTFDGFSYSNSDCQNSFSGRAAGGGIGCSLAAGSTETSQSPWLLLVLPVSLFVIGRLRLSRT